MANKQHSALSGTELHPPATHNHDTLYLKRSADDFTSVGAQKTVPTNTDLVLIEDSAAGNAKKYAQLGNLPGGGGSSTWLGLSDTPGSFSALQLVRANSTPDALEFVAQTSLRLDDFGEAEANTDLDATTVHHGLLPQLGGGTDNYLRADGTWAAPSGGSGATAWTGLTDTAATITPNKLVVASAGGVLGFTSADEADYFLKTGTRTMTGQLVLHSITGMSLNRSGILADTAYDSSVKLYGDPLPGSTTQLRVYGREHGTYAGQILFRSINFLKDGQNIAGYFEGVTDTPKLHLLYGLDMNSKNIESCGNIASGTHNTYDLGTDANRYANIYATNVVTGDLIFEERTCHICKKPFTKGEILSLITIKLSKKGTHTVPCHSSCIGGNN